MAAQGYPCPVPLPGCHRNARATNTNTFPLSPEAGKFEHTFQLASNPSQICTEWVLLASLALRTWSPADTAEAKAVQAWGGGWGRLSSTHRRQAHPSHTPPRRPMMLLGP